MKKILAFLLALSLIFLVGCTGEGNYNFTKDNFPKVGALSSIRDLAQKIAMAATQSELPNAGDLAEFPDTTYSAYEALCDKEIDILLAYAPDAQTEKYIKASGEKVEMSEIALDAVVFLTSFENPVDALTENQISGIYSGRIKTWDEVGGDDEEILPYQAADESSARELFDLTLNMGDRLSKATKDTIVSSAGELFAAASEYKNSKGAIGYTTYSASKLSANGLSSDGTVKVLSVDDVAPTAETVKSGEYPLTEKVYVAIRKSSAVGSPERILYNWICSEQGLEFVTREWY